MPKMKTHKATAKRFRLTKNGKLMLQYDPDAKAYQFYPRMGSVMTGKRNLEWREASGKGSVFSYTDTLVPSAGFDTVKPLPEVRRVAPVADTPALAVA